MTQSNMPRDVDLLKNRSILSRLFSSLMFFFVSLELKVMLLFQWNLFDLHFTTFTKAWTNVSEFAFDNLASDIFSDQIR